MAYAIVNTDNMAGTRQGALLRSFKYFQGVDRADVENGNIVKLETLMSGETEIFKAVVPTATTNLDDCVLVAGVELFYDERKRNLDEWINAKEDAQATRGYCFVPNAIFSVTAEAFAKANPTVGQIVELTGSTKLNNVATLTAGSTKVGRIIDTRVVGTKTFYSVEVKNK